jgi:Fur family ferric uptake transcriptional regulator
VPKSASTRDPARADIERQAAGALHAAGVRPTPQRVEIVSELMTEANDVTAQDLHARLRDRGSQLGLATVYRTLGRLADAGVIDSLAHDPAALCYRWCGSDHHHHFVCSRCHRVVELGDCRLDPWLDEVSSEHGVDVTGHRLEVVGLCAGCR